MISMITNQHQMEEKVDSGERVNELMWCGGRRKPRLCMRAGSMSWWSKSPKAANQHEPGISTSCSFPPLSRPLSPSDFSPSSTRVVVVVVVVTACSFALSRCKRAASAAANTPCVRFLARKARFTLERVDFAIADFLF